MCTALTMNMNGFYCGRTLDVDGDFGQAVITIPQNFDFGFKSEYAVMGVALCVDGYPLLFDGINENGLFMAGLRFGEAVYFEPNPQKTNLAPFEFIPYILGLCENVSDARAMLKNINIEARDFSPSMPATPLHWIIADKSDCITVEQSADGLKVYENNVGVLTNSPPFPFQIYNLNNYMSLTPKPADNRFSKEIPLYNHSFGMGALGLPGDLSSSSRFVRSAYYKHNILPEPKAEKTFFKVLDSCFQPKGLTVTADGTLEYTAYTTCYDTKNGICYYKNYTGDVEEYSFQNKKAHCRERLALRQL